MTHPVPTSQNGWPVFLNTAHTTKLVAYGVTWHFASLDVCRLFHYVLDQFNEHVEPIDPKTEHTRDDWSWAFRPITGQHTGYTNHASATAIDLNAVKHPRGVAAGKTFTRNQVKAIGTLLQSMLDDAGEQVIRWGGNYVHALPDPMHFEINVGPASVHQAVARLERKGLLYP